MLAGQIIEACVRSAYRNADLDAEITATGRWMKGVDVGREAHGKVFVIGDSMREREAIRVMQGQHARTKQTASHLDQLI
jgi:hypothetical protein